MREIAKKLFRKREAHNPGHLREISSNAKVKSRRKVSKLQATTAGTETELRQAKKNENNAVSMINLFHNNIKCGPRYLCTCCDQLWYKLSVVKCNAKNDRVCSQHILSCITGEKSVDDTEWICIPCHSNLKKGKLPTCGKANEMSFPKKPGILNLTPLEEWLISPRIPFIRGLPRGGQLTIHGSIVSEPYDVNSTVHCLTTEVLSTNHKPFQ